MSELKLLGIAGLLAGIGTPAVATDWQHTVTDDNNAHWYIDVDSMRRTGDYVYVWVKVDASRDNTVDYYEVKRHYKLNCATWNARLIAYIKYDESGNVMSSNSKTHDSGDIGMRPVAPGTMGNIVQSKVCG